MTDTAWIDEIEARANAATPGPWTNERQDAEDGAFYYAIHGQHYEWIVNVEEDKNLGVTMKNAAFIAASRADIPLLTTALRDSLAREKAMREALEPFANAAKMFSWPVYGHDNEEAHGSGIIVGDLRRARAALAGAQT